MFDRAKFITQLDHDRGGGEEVGCGGDGPTELSVVPAVAFAYS